MIFQRVVFLARLRYPEKWNDYLTGMTCSMTLRASASKYGISFLFEPTIVGEHFSHSHFWLNRLDGRWLPEPGARQLSCLGEQGWLPASGGNKLRWACPHF